jgi:hypothetical protein
MSRKENNGRNGIVAHANRNTVSAMESRDLSVDHIKSKRGKEVGRSRQAATVQLSRVSVRILLAVSIIVQAICVLVLGQYDPSHSGVVRHRLPGSICVPSFVRIVYIIPRFLLILILGPLVFLDTGTSQCDP